MADDPNAPRETAKWTRYLPEAFGIREAVRQSPYRWCARESTMWGIATGTAMGFHRLRMGSSPRWAGNVAFGCMFLVFVPSYYFCVKKRDYHEKYLELMMRANQIESAQQMPAQPTHDPFLSDEQDSSDSNNYVVGDQELYGRLQERKEWQKQTPTQDAKDVFQPVSTSDRK